MTTEVEIAQVILDEKLALGQLDGKAVAASLLACEAQLLLAAGASQILVPRPPARIERGMVEHVFETTVKRDALSPRVKPIDRSGITERRVIEFLRPMTARLDEHSREATFVRLAATPLYRILLGNKHRAAVYDVDVHELLHQLEGVKASRFPAEYRPRFRSIVGVFASYRPTIRPGLLPIRPGGVTSRRMVQRLENEVLENQFADLTSDYGKLGYLRHPGPLLRLIAGRASEFATRRRVGRALRGASLPAHLAGGPIGGAAVDALAEGANVGQTSAEFASPTIEPTSELNLDLWEGAMSGLGRGVRSTDPGMAATFVEHTLLRCGHSAVSLGQPSPSEVRSPPSQDDWVLKANRAYVAEWPRLLGYARKAIVS
jgi:hypothetical protein